MGTKMRSQKEGGFTLVELAVTTVIIGIVVVSFFGLFISLVSSTIIAKRRAVALTLATGQMEAMKSLPYDSLVVQSPTTTTKTLNGVKYSIYSVVRYADDAYDGCGTYPTQADKEKYCRNYPPPASSVTDTNPNDYKVARVVVSDKSGKQLATVDTQIAARVAETSSTTGALFVTIVDGSGAPIPGATVAVSNTTLSPVINKSDTTDSNGVVIFYGLPPDSGTDYIVTGSKTGYSALNTVSASGPLQPTYISQKILTQQSSSITLPLYAMSPNSLVVETTDTNGNPLGSVKVYAKGGYKLYTLASDYSYYYDNYYSNYNSGTTNDNRVTTDSGGLAAIPNLTPANGYIFCNSDAAAVGGTATNCAVGSTKYYLAAAVPYGGTNSLMPITIPTNDSGGPATTYPYTSTNYFQKVRLMLTTSSSFPRVYTMNPYQLSLAGGGLNSYQITFMGYNLSGASAQLTQGGNTYSSGSCSSSDTQLQCIFDLSTIASGTAQVAVTNSSGTLTLPTTPLGGFNVGP